jgi:hypothetical protein
VLRVLFNDAVSLKDYIASAEDERRSAEQWWNDTDRKDEVLEENPVPVTLCPPQIQHGLWTHPIHNKFDEFSERMAPTSGYRV